MVRAEPTRADNGTPNLPAVPAATPTRDLMTMAEQVAKSRLFPGIETTQAAFTLMLLCQAEDLHPATAMKRYHIINGRPSMRADAMQAEFQRQGGIIRWLKSDATECRAAFIHDRHAPDPGITITWTIERAAKAQLTNNPTWKKFPDQMLRARVVSEGVRMVLPGIVAGIYTPEEVQDFEPARAIAATVPGVTTADQIPDPAKPLQAEVVQPATTAFDAWLDRSAEALNINRWHLARHLHKALNLIAKASARPRNNAEMLAEVEAAYSDPAGREWLRNECRTYRDELARRAVAKAEPAPADDADPDVADAEREPGCDDE